MSFLQIDNGRISYEVYGADSSNPPIVLIHGFSLDKRQWGPQVENLVANGRRVITYDMRGFGESSLPTGQYSHSGDLKELLEFLEIGRAEICGHSFGGEVAIDFALKNPEMTEGLVLLAPSLGSFGVEEKSPMPGWMQIAKEGRIGDVKREILQHESLDSLRKKPEGFSLITRIVERYSGFHFTHRDPGEPTWGIGNRLSELRCPVKVIIGTEDSESSHKVAKEIHGKVSNSELQFVEGAGHFLNIENPEVVNEAINKSLEGEEGKKEAELISFK
jgi:pimeloyl-ACP methyl ester carboxylesterase